LAKQNHKVLLVWTMWLALGAAAFGAVAIGALAIGRLAVGRLVFPLDGVEKSRGWCYQPAT
jgi:hypothetical protein